MNRTRNQRASHPQSCGLAGYPRRQAYKAVIYEFLAILSGVSNIDELWGSLKDKAEVMLPPQDMAYQMREFGIKDPNGYTLIPGEDLSKK
jgi:hypothetical protein